jgi:hypothetical protein
LLKIINKTQAFFFFADTVQYRFRILRSNYWQTMMKTKSDGRRTKKNFIRIVETIANEAVDSDLSDQFIRNVKGSADEISAFLGCPRRKRTIVNIFLYSFASIIN